MAKTVLNTSIFNTDIDSHINTSTASANEVLSYTGSDYDWVAQATTDKEFTVTHSTTPANGYYFSGVGTSSDLEPTLYLIRGETYKFVVSSSSGSHPFYILTAANYSSGAVYSDGVTNNGTTSGTVTFTVPMDAPDVLYYACASHSTEAGTIYILKEPTIDTLGELTDVNSSISPSVNEFLGWDNINSRWDALNIQTYIEGRVDNHLNTNGADQDEVLQWNGSDYTWGATLSRSSFSVTTNTALNSGYLNYNSSTGVFNFAPPDLSSYLTGITGENIGSLSDVTISNVANDEVLAYQSATSSWVNQTAAEAGLATSAQGTLADSALQPADLSVTTNSAGTAALSYSNGVFTFTPPDLSSYLTAETNDLTSAVTWANVPNANITESSVTQHEAALSITSTQVTDFGEAVDDQVNTLLQAGLGIDFTYDDANNELLIDSNHVEVNCTNNSGASIPKGTPVYQSGVSGNNIAIAPADADDSAKMPAIGITTSTLANGAEGTVVVLGVVNGLDTSSFSAGDTVYISTTAGGLTTTPPTGESGLIQNFGRILKVNASSGSIAVMGAGRANAVANLNDGNVFIGNSSNQAERRALVEADISDLGTYLTGITSENIGSLSDVTITSAAAGEVLRYSGSAWINSDPIAGRFSIVNSSSSAYVFTGSGTSSDSNPTLYLTRGQTYEFVVNASGHPFYIKTVSGTGTGNAYSDGVTNNGAETGTVTLAVQMDAPDTLYYNCSAHSAMAGTIYILDSTVDLSDFSVTTNEVGTAALSYSNGVFTYTPPDLSSYLTAETNDLTSAVTWANVPNANITESSVTQHQSALSITESQISDLQTYLTGITGQSIENLSDVTTMTPTDGQVLTWDNTNSYWYAASPSGGSYNNSSVDSHLNTSTAATNEVLSWNGSDYAWVSQSGGSGIALTDLSVTTNSAGTAALSYNNTTGVFSYTPPDLSSYLTGITAQSIENLSDVNTMTPTDGQVLTWDNANSRWDAATPSGGGSYSDSSVDTHLNTSTASANEVLSWNGSDYDWVAQSGGGGGSSVTVSETAPSSPSSGDLWFDPNALKTYVYYNDGDSNQWVQANPSGGGSGALVVSKNIALNFFFGS